MTDTHFLTIETFISVLEDLPNEANFRAKLEVVSQLLRTLPIHGDHRALCRLRDAYTANSYPEWGMGKLPYWIYETDMHLKELCGFAAQIDANPGVVVRFPARSKR